MFSRFNLSGLTEEFFGGKNACEKYQKYYREDVLGLTGKEDDSFRKILRQYLQANGNLDAATMEQEWFGSVQADIFLSHSHRDETLIEAAFLFASRMQRNGDDAVNRPIGGDTHKVRQKFPNINGTVILQRINGAFRNIVIKQSCGVFINELDSFGQRVHGKTRFTLRADSVFIHSRFL